MTIGTATTARATRAAGFSQITRASPLPGQQEIAKGAIGRCVGDDQRVLKPLGHGAAAHALEERRHRVLVLTAREAGVDRQSRAGLEIAELQVAAIWELDLVRAENLEQHDLVSSARGAPQLSDRPLL